LKHDLQTPSDIATVAVLAHDRVRQKMLSEDILAPLAAIANLRHVSPDRFKDGSWRSDVAGATAVITGWYSPRLDEALLDAEPQLKFVAHTGASIKAFVPYPAIVSGRIRVSNAGLHIAEAVAEFVIAAIMEHLRFTARQDTETKAGTDWASSRERYVGRLLGAQTVGIVGAGNTGRLVINLLRPFGCRILVADPFLSAQRAAELGVEIRELDDVMATCDIVSLHAPVLPETRGMIGERQLGLMREGTFLLNTARSAILDTAALLNRLSQGGLTAALDVFDDEPLPQDSPIRSAPGVILSPHTAGHTVESYRRQGETTIAEVRRFLTGQPLQHEVTERMLATMA
jgi:phosphoglycerate dehydrogenase-like enzyme